MKSLLVVLSALVLSGCEPTCQEQGGRLVPNGEYLTFITVGKTMVPQWRTRYECVFDRLTPQERSDANAP